MGQTDHQEDGAPDPASLMPLPVEVALDYTYSEPVGEAEVTYIFPAGEKFLLADGSEVENDTIQPGMRLLLKDGAVASVKAVRLSYEPPDPPLTLDNGQKLSRVVGTIKHKGFSTVDVTWAGGRATSSPDHPYYSVTRRGYVHARELKVGEWLQGDDGLIVPVQGVSKPAFGLVDLFNIEVERYHNYYVGGTGGRAVLVHNSASPDYINTPASRSKAKDGYEPSAHDDIAKIAPMKASTVIDLSGPSVGFAKKAYERGMGFTYILRDKNTGEVLKVGKTTGGVNIYERFNRYRRKSQEYGRAVEVEVWHVGKNAEAKAIERQLRTTLQNQGERLPWDAVANPARPDLGLPWERIQGSQFSFK